MRHLLYGSKFVIHCDHKPLKTLFTFEMKNARVQRWAISLSAYGGDITYQTGKTQKADMLCRVKFNPENGTFNINTLELARQPDKFDKLDKGETLLKTGMPPISTLQQEDESLKEIFQGTQRKKKEIQ